MSKEASTCSMGTRLPAKHRTPPRMAGCSVIPGRGQKNVLASVTNSTPLTYAANQPDLCRIRGRGARQDSYDCKAL
jgi:hypothetical protein